MISIVSYTSKRFTQPGWLGGTSVYRPLQTLTGAILRMSVRSMPINYLPINCEHNESYASDLDMT